MDPIKWKSKIILVKPEGATYGIDPTPTGAANAMLLTDVQLQPMEGEDVSRNLELPYLGAQETIPAGLRAVLTGTFELVGSGAAGTAPAWGPLARACGIAEVLTPGTQVDYSPVSDNHESVTAYFQIGPSLHVLLGARGTAVCTLNAQGIPIVRVTLTGLFTRPGDQARPVPDYSAWQGPQIASKANTPTFTIAGAPFVLRSYELNIGNDVQPRLLVGAERIVIVDRAEALSVTVEAVPYASYNPFAIAEQRTRQAVVLQHGTIVGRRVRVTIPTAQQKRPSGVQQNQNIAEWPLAFTPLPTLGDDQWKITLT
ncbi:hypothetical protein [Sphingomonas sp. CROZ-RG-20F-R02-07]|uniref:phage tail tube protein n=1 Tax=Sphingomonas sp. CROZ-RG-20F-R02-07 TaxID=2914832 RepID=UPI001F59A1BA|nr:hypothetical protein [Sphingomonas sp. CROZ-RG-20F-R02-07]